MTGNDAAIDAQSRALNLAYGFDHIVIDHSRPEDVKDSRFAALTGILRGNPSITTEAGGLGRTDQTSVELHLYDVRNPVSRLEELWGP